MGVKQHLKLIFSYFLINLKKEWQYKSSFFMQIIMMLLNDAFFIVQWYITFQLVDNIGGYGFYETMLLWAISAGSYGVAATFFRGIFSMTDAVYEGRIDVFLAQPKNALVNIACSQTSISAIGDIAYSFVVLAIIGAPWYWYLLIIPVMILGGLLYASMYSTFSSLSFFIKRGDAMASFAESTLLKTDKYPPAIYNTVVKMLLSIVVPVFFFTFIPAQYIFFTFNIWWVLGYIGVVAVWITLAFVTFKLGLKKYNSGSLMGGRM